MTAWKGFSAACEAPPFQARGGKSWLIQHAEAQRRLRPQSKIADSRFKKRIGAPVDNLWVENQCSCGFYASLRKKLAKETRIYELAMQSCALRQAATQDGMVRGEPEGVMTSPDAKPTFHSESLVAS
jgi:hypothetical protein